MFLKLVLHKPEKTGEKRTVVFNFDPKVKDLQQAE